jgi:hypothetical protein
MPLTVLLAKIYSAFPVGKDWRKLDMFVSNNVKPGPHLNNIANNIGRRREIN